jgi:hypothetical protein
MKTTHGNRPSTSTRRTLGSVCLDCCRKVLSQIESAKAGILAEFRETLAGHEHVLELALSEAEALAWQTGFPQLVFPTLATEKARAVATWHSRQQSLSRRLAPAAVNVNG